MKHLMFAVRDRAARAYLPPFCLPTVEMATREFGHAANLPDHKFSLHSRDYSLYQVGEFDDNTGLILVQSEPLFIISAVQCQGPRPVDDVSTVDVNQLEMAFNKAKE